EDQATGQQNSEQGSGGETEGRRNMMPTGATHDHESQKEREKNCNAAKSWKRTAVQVALQGGGGQPLVRGGHIAHVFGQNERKQQRSYKCSQVEKYQLTPLSQVEAHERAARPRICAL